MSGDGVAEVTPIPDLSVEKIREAIRVGCSKCNGELAADRLVRMLAEAKRVEKEA